MKKWIAALLAICLMTGSLLMPAAMAAEKDEIIYANLRSGGDLDAVYSILGIKIADSASVMKHRPLLSIIQFDLSTGFLPF